MARIRTVKPEFWTSEQVTDCSPIARLLFIGMWNFCDDGGNHPASVKTLKMLIFPSDDITIPQIQSMIDELVTTGLLVQYTDNNKNFWHVTGWGHQKIEKPTYKFPRYNGTKTESAQTDSQPFDDESPKDRQPFDPVMESKGMEGNGENKKEKSACAENSGVAQQTGPGDVAQHAADKPDTGIFYTDPERKRFKLFAEWRPDPATLEKSLKIASHLKVTADKITDYAIAEFIRKNANKDSQTEYDWQQWLIQGIARKYIDTEAPVPIQPSKPLYNSAGVAQQQTAARGVVQQPTQQPQYADPSHKPFAPLTEEEKRPTSPEAFAKLRALLDDGSEGK